MTHRPTHLVSAIACSVLLFVISSCSTGDTDNDLLSQPPPPHDVAIVLDAEDAGSNAFAPSNLVVAAGGTVKWYNADFSGGYAGEGGAAHYLVSDDGTTFDSGVLEPEGVFKARFDTPGTYTYHCEFHEGMVGTITVSP